MAETIMRFDKLEFDRSIERYDDGAFVLYADHTRELEALRARVEALQEYAPRIQKCKPAKTGYLAYMAQKPATCEGEEYGWISKGHVLAAIAAQDG